MHEWRENTWMILCTCAGDLNLQFSYSNALFGLTWPIKCFMLKQLQINANEQFILIFVLISNSYVISTDNYDYYIQETKQKLKYK